MKNSFKVILTGVMLSSFFFISSRSSAQTDNQIVKSSSYYQYEYEMNEVNKTEEEEEEKQGLKTYQRLFQISSGYEAYNSLLNANLNSAYSIVSSASNVENDED